MADARWTVHSPGATRFLIDIPAARPQGVFMNSEQLVFVGLVEDEVTRRGVVFDWLPEALKVIHLIPDQLPAEAAAPGFCRWLFKDPGDPADNAIMITKKTPKNPS